MDLLKKNTDKSFNVVNSTEIKEGDIVQIGQLEGKPIYHTITTIHEQRKKRGTYVDESKRRMWARVS